VIASGQINLATRQITSLVPDKLSFGIIVGWEPWWFEEAKAFRLRTRGSFFFGVPCNVSHGSMTPQDYTAHFWSKDLSREPG